MTVSLFAVTAGFLLAATESPLDPTNPVTWVSFGVAGVVTLAFAKEWVVPGAAAKRHENRANLAETALREAAPALAVANAASDKMLAYLADRERSERKEGT